MLMLKLMAHVGTGVVLKFGGYYTYRNPTTVTFKYSTFCPHDVFVGL